ncbi:Uma2 family endonuclease [Actinoplanes oblitus]|uniref:Uma2 family endonuclease n=1 Tax=Actinoplanes oblitus TaxID=3040509 RepID=A0ABY8WET6_9ACTN|nr:Uma2 family endonuclease [Actinoplanes oblitus]WIM95457.1 Uma2 family endonuclease [Actinoplanes oblitus]
MTAVLHAPVDPRLFPPDKQDWTVDDLASLPPDLRYELIDGRLVLPSPTGIHQILGQKLAAALERNCPKGYSPVTDYSMKVDHENEPRPDVVVVHDSVLARTPAPIEKAILVVEIVSPSSHIRDTLGKIRVFAEAGVPTYLIVDPVTFDHGIELSEFRLGENGYDLITSTSGIFETEVPYPMKINVSALTALRDKYLAAQEES